MPENTLHLHLVAPIGAVPAVHVDDLTAPPAPLDERQQAEWLAALIGGQPLPHCERFSHTFTPRRLSVVDIELEAARSMAASRERRELQPAPITRAELAVMALALLMLVGGAIAFALASNVGA